MADWLKEIQSMGRGIRNGEMTVAMTGRQYGKSMIIDMESQGVEPWFSPAGYSRHYSQQHWCYNAETGKWTHHNLRPSHEFISTSDRIIVRDEDGKFHCLKDRYGVQQCELDEQELKELTFVLLGAEHIEPYKSEWFDMSLFRAKQAGIGTNLCKEIFLK